MMKYSLSVYGSSSGDESESEEARATEGRDEVHARDAHEQRC